MTRIGVLATAMTMILGILGTGCDQPPDPPKTSDNKLPDALTVIQASPREMDRVLASQKARVNYRYRLRVLRSYYERTGNMDKLGWVERELRNLREAYTFRWEGVPQVDEPEGESLANADEHLLVEYTVSARKQFLQAVRDLLTYYQETAPNSYKADRVANILQRFDPIRTYMYILDAEIPPADLKPVEVVPEADRLYAEAVTLHRQGKGLLHTFVTTDYAKQRKALLMLLELVRKYPRSTKIARAAYYIGEIYKEYFNENIRAVHWYRRAWQWDPNITLPARFQAATVHDLRLYNRAQAVELYRQVILHEQFNSSNVSFAHNRIRELTGS